MGRRIERLTVYDLIPFFKGEGYFVFQPETYSNWLEKPIPPHWEISILFDPDINGGEWDHHGGHWDLSFLDLVEPSDWRKSKIHVINGHIIGKIGE